LPLLRGAASASWRCLCYLAVPVGLYASSQGLWRRPAPRWAAAGLLLALPLAALVTWSQPAWLLGAAVLFVAAASGQRRWRAYHADLARWRREREQALLDELRALRRRDPDA